MCIQAAFLLPHPPIIIPDIGRGEEQKIIATINAFHRVSMTIRELKPDTIVLCSPHAPFYRDAFFVSSAKQQSGSFASFRAPLVRLDYETDISFVHALSKEHNLTFIQDDPKLDHGAMVPLYFIQKELPEFKLVRLGLSMLPRNDHMALGKAIAKVANDLNRKIVFVASGDLSHYLKEDGPYGFHKEGPEFDQKIIEIIKSGELNRFTDLPEPLCERAGECGYRSLLILSGLLDQVNIKCDVLSYEGPFGVGYGVAQFIPIKKDPYVRLARSAIETYVKTRSPMVMDDSVPEELLKSKAGVFVSLHRHGRLRGCIGTIIPTTSSVAEEILRNAIYACSEDPRFYPVNIEELRDLEISVDVLGVSEPIDFPSMLDPKRYGVIVSRGRKRGLLLPDLEGVDTPKQQITIALSKAGIDEDEEYLLERFEVIRHHENL